MNNYMDVRKSAENVILPKLLVFIEICRILQGAVWRLYRQAGKKLENVRRIVLHIYAKTLILDVCTTN